MNNKTIDIIKELASFFGKKLDALIKKDSIKVEDTVEVSMKGVEVMTLKGDKGDKGEKGDKGDKGDKGEPGKDGKKGDVGESGESIKGDKGDKGDQGEQGKQGLKGERGLRGFKGIDGKPGKDGSPDTGEEIIKKINKSEGLISRERIKGLKDYLERFAGRHYPGISELLHLLDTPSTYSSKANRPLAVNSTETGVDFDSSPKITVSATEPSDPVVGDLWVDTS